MLSNNEYYDEQSLKSLGINLLEGENIIWQDKPNKAKFKSALILTMLPIVLIWIAFDGAMLYFISSSFIRGSSGAPIFAYFFMLAFFAVHMTPVWIWLYNIFTAEKRYRSSIYILTDKRIIIRNCASKRKLSTVYLEKVNDISVSSVSSGSKNNIGTINIYTNSYSKHIMPYLEDVYNVQTMLNKYVFEKTKAHQNQLDEYEDNPFSSSQTEYDRDIADKDVSHTDKSNNDRLLNNSHSYNDSDLMDSFDELFSDDEDNN